MDKRLIKIARKYGLKPIYLKIVIERLARGWKRIRIAKEHKINPNTISRYSRILEREITEQDFKELLVIIAKKEEKKHGRGK